MTRKFSLLVFLITSFLFSANSQELQAKYDSAIRMTEKAQLVPAVSILKSIKSDLYSSEMFDEYFSAQYFLCVYYALVERNPQAAEDTLQANLNKAIALSGEASVGAAEMYFGIAWLSDLRREVGVAEEYYKKALDIQEKVFGSSHKKTIKTKTNYAQVLTQRNKLGRAESYLIDLIESYQKIYEVNHPEFVRLYTLAFNYYRQTTEREKELAYALAALQIGELSYGSENERILSLLRNVSNAYYESYRNEKAIEYALRELALVETLIGNTPHLRKAEIYNNMGRYNDVDGNHKQAIASFQKALKMKEDLLGKSHPSAINTSINLSMTLNKVGKLNESGERLSEILTLLGSNDTDKFDINYQRAIGSLIENLSLTGSRDSLASLFAEHFLLFQEKMNQTFLASDRHVNVLSMLEDLCLATDYQSESLNELDAITQSILWLDSINSESFKRMNIKSEQLGFLEVYSSFNGAVIDHFYKLYTRTSEDRYADEILRFSEKNKATILSPEYAIARLKDALKVPIEMLEEERRLLSELHSNEEHDNQTILKKKLSYDSIILLLKNNYEDYYNLKYNEPYISISLVQSNLSDNSSILSYVFSQRHLYTISIDAFGFDIQRQESGALSEEISNLRKNIVALEDIEQSSKDLYERLIPRKFNDQKLIISVNEFLAFLPFELLHDGTDYLGLMNPISYTPSLNIWTNYLNVDPYSNDEILAMAPDFDMNATSEDANRDLLIAIPGAKQELMVMKEYFKGEFLFSNEATKANFMDKVSKYGMIHLATHAIIDNDNPNLSRLYFTQSGDEEHYLKNHELYNLDVKANLVTLSACNTGIGEISKGEGANSLARGFIYAGVPSTVVSLWPASDKSTPELMKYFYQNLKNGQTKDVALNNARKSYLATAQGKAQHPFYWGGFVLIGDNSPIESDRNLLVYLIPSILVFVMILTVYKRRKRA